MVRRTRINRAVPKPDLTLKAGADLSATQLVELTLLDGVGQFRCLKQKPIWWQAVPLPNGAPARLVRSAILVGASAGFGCQLVGN